MAKTKTNNEDIKQLVITQDDSQIFINSNNITDIEDSMDLLLKGTVTMIRSLIPRELVNEFIELYINSIKDLNDGFELYYSNSDKSIEDIQQMIKDKNLDKLQPIDKNLDIENLLNILSSKLENNDEDEDDKEEFWAGIGHD